MTLTELVAAYPGLFYRNNRDWYRTEAFMRALPLDAEPRVPVRARAITAVPKTNRGLPQAVDIAHAYVLDPLNPVWDDYILCRDRDAQGQQVYVAGCANGHGFEIHRIIDYAQRLRVAEWK